MARNFKISVHQKPKKSELLLRGDFDGSSALELIHFLKERCRGCRKVVIDTRGLRHIYPFGQQTFRNNLYVLNHQRIDFEFTGENADEIAPENGRFPNKIKVF